MKKDLIPDQTLKELQGSELLKMETRKSLREKIILLVEALRQILTHHRLLHHRLLHPLIHQVPQQQGLLLAQQALLLQRHPRPQARRIVALQDLQVV